MESVTSTAYARTGLLGNPSDGYGGKAIGLCLADLHAEVHIEAAERFHVGNSDGTWRPFPSLGVAREELGSETLDEGAALLLAALNRFCLDHPEIGERDPGDPALGFSIRFATNIPRQVGLAGSSAIVIAALRSLARWFEADIPADRLAKLALLAETEDLNIAAGPMDRIVQAHEGLLAMDLAEPGDVSTYWSLDPTTLPPLFLAWDPQGGKPSGDAHADLKQRWRARDPQVMATIEAFRELVDEGLACLERGDHAMFCEAMNRNLALRLSIFSVSPSDLEMAKIANQCGASAKLSGSGGAVVGAMTGDGDFAQLEEAYRAAGYAFLRPQPKWATGGKIE